MAGMIVKYASIPATFSASGPDEAVLAVPVAGAGAAAGPAAEPPPAVAAALPQVGQNATPSAIWVPQFAQNAIRTSWKREPNNQQTAVGRCLAGLPSCGGRYQSPATEVNQKVRFLANVRAYPELEPAWK